MRLNNQLKTIVLLGGLSAVLIGIGSMLGPGATYLFVALALLMNVGAYFFSDKLVLRMYGARPVERSEAPRLHEIVEDLARRAEIPTPRLYSIDAPYANAFATGRNPENGVVAVTRGIVDTLSERELRGVLAHEISHIKNRDILVATIAAAIAGAITHLAQVLSFGLFFGGSSDSEDEGDGATGLIALLVAPLAATLIQLAISRSREYLADESGARISGDPEALASALARLERGAEARPVAALPATASLFIVNPLAGASVARLFSTHPPMQDRIDRLLEMAHELRRGAA
jgi:heat shock protein HtpX